MVSRFQIPALRFRFFPWNAAYREFVAAHGEQVLEGRAHTVHHDVAVRVILAHRVHLVHHVRVRVYLRQGLRASGFMVWDSGFRVSGFEFSV